jgi:glycyl-tRNA synthetase beta chain
MADLLLELFSEEIPARMQARAEADLKSALTEGLKTAGVMGNKVAAMSGPRRLAVVVEGLPERSADVEEERKGPKVGAPEQAVAGFLRGAGLSDISEAEVRTDPKKGDFYVAVRKIAGRPTADIVAELVPEIVKGFHWPKSMRWGTGDLRWVRPLQRILCVLDGAVVPFEVGGVESGNLTEGHRVMGRGPFTVTGLDSYVSQLGGEGHVRLTRDDRKGMIATEAARVCAEAGLELVDDIGLLEEVTGLAEWPVVILGDMDPAFLELPPEVIKLSMRTHQKYFAVRDPKTGDLAPKFVVVANIEPNDGGTQIAAGNAKVLSARLDDGRFFYGNDVKTGLAAMGEKLSTIQFKEELGSIADKVERVAALARELAPKVGADPDLAERAARLMKNDLVSEMVYEFPELQGIMGRYYAQAAGETEAVADAIRDHYQPQGPSNPVPTAPVSIAVALADKLDTLVGFWAIDEKPTGSKDPFALRRAALGVLALIFENELRLSLVDLVVRPLEPLNAYFKNKLRDAQRRQLSYVTNLSGDAQFAIDLKKRLDEQFPKSKEVFIELATIALDLGLFFAERLKQQLRDNGERHDLIDAVFPVARGDFYLIKHRVEALGIFLESDDGANLLAGYKRAANILRAEEKKEALPDDLSVNAKLIAKGPAEEQALHKALTGAQAALSKQLDAEDFAAAMGELAKLRAPVDAFFEGVMVNDDDAAVRENRLALLSEIRSTIHRVADFSKIEG